MKLTNDQLLKLSEKCQKSSPFPAPEPVKVEKGKEKEAEQAAKEHAARVELYDTAREALPDLISELLALRHKLNV